MWRFSVAGLLPLLVLVLALPAAAGSEPPDLTGVWTPTTGGTWELSASGPGLDHLTATWQGTGAHADLHGSFEGSLDPAGTSYTGSFKVDEGAVHTGGEMTFKIDSPTMLTVLLNGGSGGTIVMNCTEGDCAGGDVSFQFTARADHPSNISSPFGRHKGWLESAHAIGPSFVEAGYEEDQGGSGQVLVYVEFRVVRKQLHENKPDDVRTLTLRLAVTKVDYPRSGNFPGALKLTPCPVGSAATMVLTDDKRLLPGGSAEREQTRDEVVVSTVDARCSYLDATYTNADSSSVTPFVGGPKGSGSGAGRGGEWAIVQIR